MEDSNAGAKSGVTAPSGSDARERAVTALTWAVLDIDSYDRLVDVLAAAKRVVDEHPHEAHCAFNAQPGCQCVVGELAAAWAALDGGANHE